MHFVLDGIVLAVILGCAVAAWLGEKHSVFGGS